MRGLTIQKKLFYPIAGSIGALFYTFRKYLVLCQRVKCAGSPKTYFKNDSDIEISDFGTSESCQKNQVGFRHKASTSRKSGHGEKY
jgi:hypothetical protein